jgi:hypothetical protein
VDPSREEVVALRRYFLWANQFKLSFHECVADARVRGVEPYEFGRTEYAVGPADQHLAYWLAALHVVAEGWECVRLTDASVDRLLQHSANRGLLKDYRHCVFHYQRTLSPKRVVALLKQGEAIAPWAVELHDAFKTALFPQASDASRSPQESAE